MRTKITMNTSKNLSVESAYELFIRKCRVKNLSQATITSYNNKVIPFVEFCGGDISAVTVDTVDAFTDMLKKEHNVNDVSVVSYLRSVRAFLYYCMECNYMTSFKIHLPKCNKEIKEIYTDEQLEKLLKKPDTNTCSFTEYKTWVFENYLIATGNRLSTALNVQIRDLNFEDGIITLRKTKNRKQQIIPLSASLADVLQEYLVVRGGQPEDYLFCNNYGEQASNRTWQTLVYRYNVKRDVNVTSIHAFRHSFARLWILNHGDIMRLKTILGHSKSKVLDSSCCYPVYDDMGEYLAFIESWTDVFTSVTYWNVYYPNYVEHWSNEGAEEHMISTTMAVGLPIHYHNFCDTDYNFGESLLTDIKPILDELEDILSKLGDAIYVNSLNVMPVAIGQRIESSIPADATGYVLNLDAGDFKYANCNMDYNTIKLYLDNLKQMLNDISCIPAVLGSNTNIANVSSVAMQILYAMAQVNGDETKKWLNVGFRQRFERFQRILSMQGIKVDSDVDVIYNVSMPVATTEMIANLKALQEMGAISKETIMEKSDIVSDVEVEKSRLGAEYIEDNVVE